MGIKIEGLEIVTKNIGEAFDRRYMEILVKCYEYENLAVQTLRKSQGTAQGEGQFWTNQTGDAITTVFGRVIDRKNIIGWMLAHLMKYGEYLEERNHALEKTVRLLVPYFMDDLRKIFT